MGASQSGPKSSIVAAYALISSITILTYLVALLSLSPILIYIMIIDILLVIIFPLLFRRAAAVVATFSYLAGYYLLMTAVWPTTPEVALMAIQLLAIPYVLQAVAFFAFGRVLSSVSKIAGAIFYGVAIVVGVFALLYVVAPRFYAFYFLTSIILNLLLVVAWLIVAIEVVKRRG